MSRGPALLRPRGAARARARSSRSATPSASATATCELNFDKKARAEQAGEPTRRRRRRPRARPRSRLDRPARDDHRGLVRGRRRHAHGGARLGRAVHLRADRALQRGRRGPAVRRRPQHAPTTRGRRRGLEPVDRAAPRPLTPPATDVDGPLPPREPARPGPLRGQPRAHRVPGRLHRPLQPLRLGHGDRRRGRRAPTWSRTTRSRSSAASDAARRSPATVVGG